MTESIIPVADLQRFGEDCLVAVGCGREHAAAHIAVLVEADKRGHYSHGFNRLDIYCGDIARYSSCSQAETAATRVSNKVTRRFPKITEKAPTRAFSWLKAPTSAFTFKTLLRHYAKRALTPR